MTFETVKRISTYQTADGRLWKKLKDKDGKLNADAFRFKVEGSETVNYFVELKATAS